MDSSILVVKTHSFIGKNRKNRHLWNRKFAKITQIASLQKSPFVESHKLRKNHKDLQIYIAYLATIFSSYFMMIFPPFFTLRKGIPLSLMP